jgi:CubicO group peptidase (beta-lactamase class C family)
MGLPASEDARVVDALPPTAEELTAGPLPPMTGDPLAALPLPRGDALGLFSRINDEQFRRVAPPAAGVVAGARGLAALYACLRHDVHGEPRLVGDDTLARMSQIQVAGIELGTGLEARFGVLFQAPCPPRWDFGRAGAFGHDGAGGSLAFCDPSVDVAFGYTVQRLPLPGGMDARAMELTRLVRTAVRGA